MRWPKKRPPSSQVPGQFWGISAWMLELILVLSAVLGKYSDLIVVSALLGTNAVLSFVQERRAAGVVETLRRRLASSVDRSQSTMSTLYGNDIAVEHARSQSLADPYPPGATLSLVTWSQRRDAHWFGGKLPSALRSIETVTAGRPSATPPYAYQRVFAAPEVKGGAQIPDSTRAAFIVAQEPAVMP
jgi:hypothetical protein